jgi:hypothetical protein
MIYIQVSVPEEAQVEETGFKKVIRRLVGLIIPKANPDFDHKIQLVSTWLLEFEDNSSIPSREIGLDQDRNVIVKMPYKKNYGYWIDNNLTFSDFQRLFKIEHIAKEYFEKEWDKII